MPTFPVINRAKRRELSITACTGALCLGLAACGGSAPTQPTGPSAPSAPAPTITRGTILQAPTGKGLMSGTTFTFTTVGFLSSDGSELSYAWDFGDGSPPGTGATGLHQYQTIGEFDVRLTVANASGQTATATANRVVVGSVSGEWIGLFPRVADAPIPFNLEQTGANISGTGGYAATTTTVTGTALHPVRISLAVTAQPGPGGVAAPFTFYISGNADASLDTFTATLTGLAICPCTGTLTRR